MIVPEIGGATVFPELKLTLFPSKHDAVLWWNLFPNGEQDMTTLHAGCPVLIGEKWGKIFKTLMQFSVFLLFHEIFMKFWNYFEI